ncbi:RHS repeat-associated core domain-containing protein [Nonlabens sp.]|uniref:RHS repeat-associated core domain-containing protein n=1 Tax=Nonlabens sp. TaxID=1888209 RepID=UPI003F699331
MLLNNRHGSVDSDAYRYGFQGQERDDEVKGEGNSYNYTFRMHDPRLGRFFAVDPIDHKYPYYTPYQFSGNKVIHARELEGLEEEIMITSPYVRDKIQEYLSCGDIVSAIGAARNAYMWQNEGQIKHAQKSFKVNGQTVGQPSSIVTNSHELETKGFDVRSYNNEGEIIYLFGGSVTVRDIPTDINEDDEAWYEPPIKWVNSLFEPGNANDTSSSNSDQGGITFTVRTHDPRLGGNRTTGQPDQVIDITELYEVASGQAGSAATMSRILNGLYAANKSIGAAKAADEANDHNKVEEVKDVERRIAQKDATARKNLQGNWTVVIKDTSFQDTPQNNKAVEKLHQERMDKAIERAKKD